MTFSLLLICVALSLLGAIWKLFIYPIFLSPLSSIPSAHPLASWTSGWIFWIRYKRREIATIHAAHQKHGTIIRLGPNEISVNCVKGGIQTVYSGGFEKGIPQGNWYAFFTNWGVENMFSMARNKPHSARKRMLSNIYSKSSLHSSQAMSAMTVVLIHDRLLPLLTGAAKAGTSVNMWSVFGGITMDMVTGYLFGLAASSDFTTNTKQRDRFLQLYISRQDFAYWPQEWPRLYAWLASLGYDLSPKHVDYANSEIEKWALGLCDVAEASFQQGVASGEQDSISVGDHPVVYSQLKTAMLKDEARTSFEKPCPDQFRFEIASELLDHLAAGFDTSAITLTFLAQQLSYPHNSGIVKKLRAELLSLELDPSTRLPNAKDLDNAPYLQAVLQEILRLRAAIPGSQPRTTPDVKGGSTLGPIGEYTGIPGGVRISAQAWSLHRNADVFPDPEDYRPERWLKEVNGELHYSPTSEMNRWFWAFGSGGRMCVGSNLAIYRKSPSSMTLSLG